MPLRLPGRRICHCLLSLFIVFTLLTQSVSKRSSTSKTVIRHEHIVLVHSKAWYATTNKHNIQSKTFHKNDTTTEINTAENELTRIKVAENKRCT